MLQELSADHTFDHESPVPRPLAVGPTQITFLLSEPSYDAKNIIYLLKIVKFLVIVLSTSLKKCRNRTTLTLLNYNLCNGGLLQQKNADWIIFQETN